MNETHDDKVVRLRSEVAAGGRMREVLEGPVGQALDELEGRVVKQWKLTSWPQKDVRELAYFYLCAIADLRVLLTRTVETGKLAENELEAMLAQRARAMGG